MLIYGCQDFFINVSVRGGVMSAFGDSGILLTLHLWNQGFINNVVIIN